MTPPLDNINGSSKIIIDSIIELVEYDELWPGEELDDGDMDSKLDEIMRDGKVDDLSNDLETIELANMATHAIIEFNSFICVSFSMKLNCLVLRCISRVFNIGLFLIDSINWRAYEQKSSLVFDRASDMNPIQKITSLFRVPKQNEAAANVLLSGDDVDWLPDWFVWFVEDWDDDEDVDWFAADDDLLPTPIKDVAFNICEVVERFCEEEDDWDVAEDDVAINVVLLFKLFKNMSVSFK